MTIPSLCKGPEPLYVIWEGCSDSNVTENKGNCYWGSCWWRLWILFDLQSNSFSPPDVSELMSTKHMAKDSCDGWKAGSFSKPLGPSKPSLVLMVSFTNFSPEWMCLLITMYQIRDCALMDTWGCSNSSDVQMLYIKLLQNFVEDV